MTVMGEFRLRPVEEGDLPLITSWMNDPAVAAFWELAGPPEVTERHLRPQLAPGGPSRPYLGLLGGEPISYWEVYQAARDRLADHYPAGPDDLGVHLLIGPPSARGRGLGAVLIDAVAGELLRDCARVVAEPDVRNTASVRSFERAGFRRAGELQLPEKRAVLMIRERTRTESGR
ncbi:GNAT family N-acetyltransferase [Kitasatospora sp. GP30]|uniref:GNAT family N-acetyltransferase n=1 Tax=Kitasatospora sp. GP30 TaxID=3035084 RepID=UPI0024745817|nr:GNAT family N-acetyltransferase [Kitasatospora sp. GP30]